MELTLTINEKTARVKPGATILEAARSVGAEIPTLCHDDRLKPYGGCRLCMVELEGTPRRMLPACTTPVADGMRVVTQSASLLAARRSVLELLLINHPLDCPVCDKAGECRLQDLVHEHGLGPGNFAEQKRTAPPDYVSPFLERNHDRCILCGKCVRTCAERCGAGALAFSMRGAKTRVSTAFDRPLDCEFCGECLEICPVGALTAKQSKYKARPWNVEQAESSCVYCGCGCPVTFERREGRIIRARSSNGHYLCAKGRFGWDAVRHASRLAMPKMRVNGTLVDCSWEEALSAVASGFRMIQSRYGPDHIGGLGSVRTTNEDNYLFQKFMRTVLGTNNIDLLTRASVPYGLNSRYFCGELSRLGEHDVILLLDNDVGAINALTGIEIVRAVNRCGSKLVLADGGVSKFSRLAAAAAGPEPREAVLSLVAGMKGPACTVNTGALQAVQLLRAARSTALILPAQMDRGMLGLIEELCGFLKQVTHYPLVSRGNIQGALDMGVLPDLFPGYRAVAPGSAGYFALKWNMSAPGTAGKNGFEMLAGIGQGDISALYIMGDDPAGSTPRFQAALAGLEFLVVQDIFLTETAKMASVVLPAASFVEKSGTMTTIERKLVPINQVLERFAESRPDWEIIGMVASEMGEPIAPHSPPGILREIRALVPMYEELAVGKAWEREKSPLHNMAADLSLGPGDDGRKARAQKKPSVFSSGMMTARSGELRTIPKP